MAGSGPGQLSGQVYFITGATGIAAATALQAARQGADLVVASLSESECRQLAAAVEAVGARCAWLAGDLRDEATAENAVLRGREAFGRLDGVIAVAGGSGRRFGDGPLHDIPLAGWSATMSLNVTPAFLAAREGLRVMIQQEPSTAGSRGSVVLISSVLATSPAADHFATHAYAAAKGALLALTRSAAAYYAPSLIRVNAVAPGLVATPMAARAAADPDIVAYAARKQPLAAGLLEADDVADAALFLVLPQSRRITGQVLIVDGGWSVTEA